MRFFRWTGVVIVVLLQSLAGAEAGRRAYHLANIYDGRAGRIAYFAVPNKFCGKAAEPQISVVEQPSYGTIALKPEWQLANGTVTPGAGKCDNRLIEVTSVFYEPAQGFYGSDRLVLRVSFPAAEGRPAETMLSEIYVKMR